MNTRIVESNGFSIAFLFVHKTRAVFYYFIRNICYMKKDTFVKIMKNLLKHIDDSEKIGKGLKELIKMRSSIIEEFSDGLDLIFYDDIMVENIVKTMEDEFNDEKEFIVCWFYEYRTMSSLYMNEMKVEKETDNGKKKWVVGCNPENDEENLGLLYDLLVEYYV